MGRRPLRTGIYLPRSVRNIASKPSSTVTSISAKLASRAKGLDLPTGLPSPYKQKSAPLYSEQTSEKAPEIAETYPKPPQPLPRLLRRPGMVRSATVTFLRSTVLGSNSEITVSGDPDQDERALLSNVGYELLDIRHGGFSETQLALVNPRRKKTHHEAAWRALLDDGCQKVAVKHVKDAYDCNEIKIFSASLDHPHVVKMYEAFVIDTDLYLTQEACTGGTLSDLVQTRKTIGGDGIGEVTARQYTFQVAHGLTYLHTRGICHRDLTPEHLHLDETQKYIKITGFAMASMEVPIARATARRGSTLQQPPPECILCRSKGGEFSFTAPERLFGNEGPLYDAIKSDVYSLGAIMYLMINGKKPFEKKETGDKLDDFYVNFMARQDLSNLTWIPYASPESKDLILKLINHEPMDRISLQGVLDHQWYYDPEEPKHVTDVTKMADIAATKKPQSVRVGHLEYSAREPYTLDSLPPLAITPLTASTKPVKPTTCPSKYLPSQVLAQNVQKRPLRKKCSPDGSDSLSSCSFTVITRSTLTPSASSDYSSDMDWDDFNLPKIFQDDQVSKGKTTIGNKPIKATHSNTHLASDSAFLPHCTSLTPTATKSLGDHMLITGLHSMDENPPKQVTRKRSVPNSSNGRQGFGLIRSKPKVPCTENIRLEPIVNRFKSSVPKLPPIAQNQPLVSKQPMTHITAPNLNYMPQQTSPTQSPPPIRAGLVTGRSKILHDKHRPVFLSKLKPTHH